MESDTALKKQEHLDSKVVTLNGQNYLVYLKSVSVKAGKSGKNFTVRPFVKHITPPQIKAIFFDLDDTLCNFSECEHRALTEVYNRISEKYGISHNRLKQKYRKILAEPEDVPSAQKNTGVQHRTKLFANLLAHFQITDTNFIMHLANEYYKSLESGIALFPDVQKILAKLQHTFALYLVIEGYKDTQQMLIDWLNIKAYFQDIFISGEIGKTKLDGGLFSYALAQSNLASSEVILVGDSYKKDVVGALTAGIRIIWLNKKKEELFLPFIDEKVIQITELQGLENISFFR